MNKTYSVEIGRAVLDGNKITAEIGRFDVNHENQAKFDNGASFDLCIQNDENGFYVSVYVNGNYMAVGKIQYTQNMKNIVIESIATKDPDRPVLQVGQIITLNSDENNAYEIVDIVNDDVVIAHGKITKGLCSNKYYVMVTDCIDETKVNG